MLTLHTFAALSATAALGLAACGAASAAPSTETVSVKVSYADLNLSTPEGAQTMLHRIRAAAEKVCGEASDDPIDRIYEWRPCVKSATNRAVAHLGNPIVTALNSGKSAPEAMALASNR